jgi:hypothetical protein
MRNLLDSSICNKFQPSFDNRECEFYQYAENDKMESIVGECGFCKRPETYRCVADITRTISQSHSSVGNFLTCHYYYYLTKIIGVEVRSAHLPVAMKAGKLWDCCKQFHLGAKVIKDRGGIEFKSPKDVVNAYEIDPITVAKVRALFKAYKELEIKVEPGYELQAEVNLDYTITLPPSSFIPSISVGKEAINLWQARQDQNVDERVWEFPLKVTGFFDRKYSNYFTEDKLSGRPENYLDPFMIDSQMSTYFLADPNLEWVIMEVVTFPQQKELKKKEESPEQIMERIYQDILSRPSRYFAGWSNQKRMYGVKFFRNEMNLKAAEERYKQVVIDIQAARWSNIFYKDFTRCGNMYGSFCPMRPLCKSGNISEEIYKIRGK